jgi:hypothetical protein
MISEKRRRNGLVNNRITISEEVTEQEETSFYIINRSLLKMARNQYCNVVSDNMHRGEKRKLRKAQKKFIHEVFFEFWLYACLPVIHSATICIV